MRQTRYLSLQSGANRHFYWEMCRFNLIFLYKKSFKTGDHSYFEASSIYYFAAIGSRMLTVVPSFTLLWIEMDPLCSLMIFWQIINPKPVPFSFVL
jgi:hypothetical protein